MLEHPRPASRASRAAGRALLLAVGGVAALLLAELAVAVLRPVYLAPADYFDAFYVPDAELGYRMRPGFRGTLRQDYEARFEINALGLRDRDYGPRARDVLRILAVGDSYTFGAGVQLQETFAKQLQERLVERGLSAEVVNAGTSGYGTLQYAALLRRLIPVYQPDAALVMVTFNDPGNDVATERGIFPCLKTGHPAKRWLKRHSHLAKRVWLAYLALVEPSYSFADAGTLYAHAGESGERGKRSRHGFELFDGAVEDMVRTARRSGVAIVFTASSDAGHLIARHTRALCERLGVPFVDGFRRIAAGEVDVAWRGENSAGHWSPEGHAEIATVLADSVAWEDMARGTAPTPAVHARTASSP
jgi:lysophospholipase L1-like esterase